MHNLPFHLLYTLNPGGQNLTLGPTSTQVSPARTQPASWELLGTQKRRLQGPACTPEPSHENMEVLYSSARI